MASGAAIYVFGLFVQLEEDSRVALQRRWRRHYALVTRGSLPYDGFSSISWFKWIGFLILGLNPIALPRAFTNNVGHSKVHG